jgi:hypothetical protein
MGTRSVGDVRDVRERTVELDEFRASRPGLVRWAAVLSGTVIGLGALGFLTALWLALGWGSEVDFVRDNFEWFEAASAVLALFIGGYVAGYSAGLRGWGPGMMNALTMWGLLFVAAVSFGVPSILNVFNVSASSVGAGNGFLGPQGDSALWATAISLISGAIVAALGGAAGGATARGEQFFSASDVDRDEDSDGRPRYTAGSRIR